jgi:hypothetical protein
MAISVTCSCGARLEIDDKFAGKAIPCPDCQRPLNTHVQVEAPQVLAVSGLAITSLVLALVGSFTIVGSLAAVGVGYLGLRQIARAPDRIGGLNFARAGMILGGACTLAMLAALMSSSAFGIDSLLREFRHAAELDYKTELGGQLIIKQSNRDHDFVIQRPSSAWGSLKAKGEARDLLTLVNLREDAQLAVLPLVAEDEASALDKAVECFRQSDLFRNLSKPSDARAQSPEPEARKVADSKDLTLDVRLGGYERTVLLRVVKIQKGGDIFLLVAGARKGRFAGLVEEFRRSFDSFKVQEEKAE